MGCGASAAGSEKYEGTTTPVETIWADDTDEPFSPGIANSEAAKILARKASKEDSRFIIRTLNADVVNDLEEEEPKSPGVEMSAALKIAQRRASKEKARRASRTSAQSVDRMSVSERASFREARRSGIQRNSWREVRSSTRSNSGLGRLGTPQRSSSKLAEPQIDATPIREVDLVAEDA